MNIGIVGLGLIGGTYAKSLRPYPYKLYGIDIDQDTLQYAREHNIVDVATDDPKSVLKELDVVFICLYPKAAISFLRKYITSFKRDAIISDVVGIKRYMVDSVDMYQHDDVEFVLSHPIAGRETVGINNSDKNIFHNANFVITPTKFNTEHGLNLIETLAKQMGFKHVSRITDVEHDNIIGFTSQLTHAIALALMNSDEEKFDTSRFIGDSFKDLTRIANMNDALWAELFIGNKDFLMRHINNFEKELDLIKAALEKKDVDTLKTLMQKATERRQKLNVK